MILKYVVLQCARCESKKRIEVDLEEDIERNCITLDIDSDPFKTLAFDVQRRNCITLKNLVMGIMKQYFVCDECLKKTSKFVKGLGKTNVMREIESLEKARADFKKQQEKRT